MRVNLKNESVQHSDIVRYFLVIAIFYCANATVVLKRFGSWAKFVFQKPFAGHKN